MPRFFFNQVNGKTRITDEEGSMLHSMQAVRAEAVASAQEIVSNELLAGRGLCRSTFEVTDEFGKIVLVLPFEQALRPDEPLFVKPSAA